MRLLRVELDRLRSRRAVALVLLVAALLTVLLAGTAIWDTRPVGPDERAAAEVQAANVAQDPMVRRDIDQCQEAPEEFVGPDATAAECEQLLTPRAEDFLSRAQLDLGRVVDGRAVGLVVIVTALLIICGATFAGGDWTTGSMSNQLLFRPRRLSVWTAKAAAVVIVAALCATALIGGFWLALYLTAESRGIVTPDPVLRDIGWTSARGIALATAAALGGYALTMLLRSTVATMAVLFAYAVGGEALVAAVPVDRVSRWSPANNVFAWVDGGTRVFDPDRVCAPGSAGCLQSYVLGPVHGAVYLGALLLLAVVVSVLSFRRRDLP